MIDKPTNAGTPAFFLAIVDQNMFLIRISQLLSIHVMWTVRSCQLLVAVAFRAPSKRTYLLISLLLCGASWHAPRLSVHHEYSVKPYYLEL